MLLLSEGSSIRYAPSFNTNNNNDDFEQWCERHASQNKEGCRCGPKDFFQKIMDKSSYFKFQAIEITLSLGGHFQFSKRETKMTM
jgi:hypothetical protein